VQRKRAPFRGERDFPALRRLGLLRRAGFGYGDATAPEREHQRRSREDSRNSFFQRVDRQPCDVEIDVLRIQIALEEETQVAAAFDGEAVLVRACAEQPDKLKVEEFDDLPVRQHGFKTTLL